jgi:hypothetical protein
MRLTAHAVAQAYVMGSNMPDYGFGRCDDHHKIVDFYSACVLSNLLSFLFKEPNSVLKRDSDGGLLGAPQAWWLARYSRTIANKAKMTTPQNLSTHS